jgi:hypothetical protein
MKVQFFLQHGGRHKEWTEQGGGFISPQEGKNKTISKSYFC